MANRRVSVNMRSKLKKDMKMLDDMQVIEKVTEQTPWISQLVITPKKGSSLLICIDTLALNKVLQWEHYTMPVLEEVLHELREAKVFSKARLIIGLLACGSRGRGKQHDRFPNAFWIVSVEKAAIWPVCVGRNLPNEIAGGS